MRFTQQFKRDISWWEHFWFFFVLSLDNMGNALIGPRDAHPGVTMSSHAGTAKAHRLYDIAHGIQPPHNKWGCVACDTLLAWWPFGPELILGSTSKREHCKLAIESDIKRAKDVLFELEGDPVVSWYLAQP